MALQFKGKVWVFGDNLDVDFEILSFRELDQGIIAPDKMGEWCMRVEIGRASCRERVLRLV